MTRITNMHRTVTSKWLQGLFSLQAKFTDSVSSHPLITRWILAGPVTIIASILIMGGMAFWIPAGEAKVNNIAIPIIILPIIWACCFFYACIEENLPRAVLILSAITGIHLILVISAFV